MKLAVSPSRRLAALVVLTAVAIPLAVSLRVEAAAQTPGGGTPLGGIPTTRLRNIATTFFGGAAPYTTTPACNPHLDAHDRAQGVSLLADGRVLIASNTACSDFVAQFGTPTPTPQFPTYRAGSEGYVAILSSDLHTVERWTYVPGSTDPVNSVERAYYAVEDSQGNIWVTGFTKSGTGFALGNTLLNGVGGVGNVGPGGDWDVFVVKFDSTLSQKLWAVRFGGSDQDNPRATIAVVDEGTPPVPVAYISGHTASADFNDTLAAAPDHAQGCIWDAFVVKLNTNGTLAWSKVLGGNDYDDAYANVRVHPDGQSIYIGGLTRSQFGTLYASAPGYDQGYNGPQNQCSCTLDASCAAGDGFVARIDTAGNLLAWTYIGGDNDDQVSGNDGLELVPGTNQIVVCGNTKSANWTWPAGQNPLRLDSTFNGVAGTDTDAYVAVLSEDLSMIEFHTFFGGNELDEPGGLAADDVGNIYFGGNTSSDQTGTVFPLTGSAYDATYAGDINGDAFIAKINVNLPPPPAQQSATLVYSTYFGGGTFYESVCTNCNGVDPNKCPGWEGDRIRSMVLTASGKVLCCGDTDTTDFPTYPTTGIHSAAKFVYDGGDSDGFVAIHNAN
ncbi:MAG: hypothetical protein K8S98_15335 [Planctomycetes bacterium]|nr:hypothetical protein [Planctomycetota bacterium]